jgi:CSLREA domain-containing protein
MNKHFLRGIRNALIAMGWLACSSGALAAVISVTTTADVIANDGLCSLREAIINANNNSRLFAATGECAAGSGVDTINLPAGTYNLTIPPTGTNDATTGDLNITAQVNIVGSGNPTVQGGPGWTDRVFFISFSPVSMSGFTISGGNLHLAARADGGAGIRVGGALTLSNMTVSGNTLTVSNFVDGPGGGIYVTRDGSLTLTNSTVAGNHAPRGAGIWTLGPLTVTGSTVSGNQGTATVIGDGNGAGIVVAETSASIANSTISGNSGAGRGGGLHFELPGPSDVVNLSNVTIANNSATEGGGIYLEPGTLNLNNVTIANNSATQEAGGIFATRGTYNLSNTIIAGNAAPISPNCENFFQGPINSNGNNLIGNNTGCTISGVKASDKIGTGASPINPLLAALANNGGSTQTMALQKGSPAIDAGNNATCAATDQRGFARPEGPACDMGAYEVALEITGTVVEFFNTILGHYFITANAAEQASIDAGGSGPGWSRTGNNFKSGGGSRVCRFYGTPGVGPNSHFYTVDVTECEQVKLDPGWHFESFDFSATPPAGAGTCATGTIPVYRAYNNGFAHNDSNHRYSTSLGIYNGQISAGWHGEGVVFCAPG